MTATDGQVSYDTESTTYNRPPSGGGRRMSSRRDDVRRVGGSRLLQLRPPTRRLASLVGDLPHKGGGVRRLSGDAFTFLIAISVLLFALIGLSLDKPDTAVLQEAERCFATGVAARSDASAARRWFAQSAREYDDLWQRGFHNPALALNRARAHRLAGNLPAAIAALQAGLSVARFDRTLQVELEDCRSAVEYPNDELAVECRPRPISGIGSRMAPVEAYLFCGALWLAACLCLARLAMTRRPAWLVAAAIAFIALAALGGLWFQDWRQREANARPLAIVERDCSLRTGNGTAWPNRFAGRLPRGVEVRILGRRGGWVQVELAAGAVGWLPESCLLPIG